MHLYTQNNLPINTKAHAYTQLPTFTIKQQFTVKHYTHARTHIHKKYNKHVHNESQGTHLVSCMNKADYTCEPLPSAHLHSTKHVL